MTSNFNFSIRKIPTIIWKIILVIIIIISYNYFFEKNYSSYQKVYCVGKLGKINRIYGQGSTIDFTFKYLGNKENNFDYLGNNKVDKNQKLYLIEVPVKAKAKSRILWDYPVPDTLKAPYEGWDEIPEFLKKREGN